MTQVDIINQVLGIAVDSPLHQVRQFREKVVKGTQDSYDALFSDKLTVPLTWRYAVAVFSSRLVGSVEFEQHYRALAEQSGLSAEALDLIVAGEFNQLEDKALTEVLRFTQKLSLKPVEGDKDAVLILKKAGIATHDIVALSQLIAFLSYQLRLAAGLKAMAKLV